MSISAAAIIPGEKPALPSVKVLLVDDRKENLRALESLIREDTRHRADIHLAASGREALELLLDHDFGLAILDVQMPEINGFELAELMRGSAKTRHIPIIFVTAGAIDPRHTFLGYEAGAVDFLYKPLDARIVRGKIHVFLELEEQRLVIQRQIEELAKELRVREEFFSIASHELKTPLTSLKLQIQMLQRGVRQADSAPNPERWAKTLGSADQQINKLQGLIDDLLDVSRIQAGKLSVTLSETNLSELTRDVVERFSFELQRARCSIDLDLADDLVFLCDPFRVEQVLINLLSNATKYAPGSIIRVRTHRDQGSAVLSIADEGPGIPSDKLESIFNRFERISDDLKIQGLGLGLYIVRQIMKAHGGSIAASSQPGKGTTFVARFPMASAEV